MNEWMDGWIDGWMDEYSRNVYMCICRTKFGIYTVFYINDTCIDFLLWLLFHRVNSFHSMSENKSHIINRNI